jgi:hypothetical protein
MYLVIRLSTHIGRHESRWGFKEREDDMSS